MKQISMAQHHIKYFKQENMDMLGAATASPFGPGLPPGSALRVFRAYPIDDHGYGGKAVTGMGGKLFHPSDSADLTLCIATSIEGAKDDVMQELVAS